MAAARDRSRERARRPWWAQTEPGVVTLIESFWEEVGRTGVLLMEPHMVDVGWRKEVPVVVVRLSEEQALGMLLDAEELGRVWNGGGPARKAVRALKRCLEGLERGEFVE